MTRHASFQSSRLTTYSILPFDRFDHAQFDLQKKPDTLLQKHKILHYTKCIQRPAEDILTLAFPEQHICIPNDTYFGDTNVAWYLFTFLKLEIIRCDHFREQGFHLDSCEGSSGTVANTYVDEKYEVGLRRRTRASHHACRPCPKDKCVVDVVPV
jgi:hypothetical protein